MSDSDSESDDKKSDIKLEFKYNCWTCDFHTDKKSNFTRHDNSINHKKKTKKNPNIELFNNILYIFINVCIICRAEFTYEGESNLCWNCRLNNIDEMVEYKKCKNTRNFCYENDCLLCYNRSFLSSPKYIYLDIEYGINPRQIAKQSHNIFNFLCNCKHKFASSLDNVYKNQWCPYCCYPPKKLCNSDEKCDQCYNNSFASHPMSKYWSKKNKLKPRQVFKQSGEKYWFNCDKCPHEFDQSLDHIVGKNTWCRYCAHRDLCEEDCNFCYNNSFASHPRSKYWSKKNKLNPRQIFKQSSEKYWFNCDKCLHEFDQSLNNIVGKNTWCRYCAHRDLCEKDCNFCYNNSFAPHPMSKYWSKKNKLNPRQVFPNSNEEYIFDCNVCNGEFKIRLYNINNGYWCNICKNKTELRFKTWLNKTFDYKLDYQSKFEWCKNIRFLPFDFGIELFNLLIELDGRQHFQQVQNWTPYKITQKRDIYKMKQALKNNKTVIRISQEDIWYDRYNWKEDITQYIKKQTKPQIIYLSKNKNLYNDHKQLLNTTNILDSIFKYKIVDIITKYL
jgi:very-short-patch-repair endonuclease